MKLFLEINQKSTENLLQVKKKKKKNPFLWIGPLVYLCSISPLNWQSWTTEKTAKKQTNNHVRHVRILTFYFSPTY